MVGIRFLNMNSSFTKSAELRPGLSWTDEENEAETCREPENLTFYEEHDVIAPLRGQRSTLELENIKCVAAESESCSCNNLLPGFYVVIVLKKQT